MTTEIPRKPLNSAQVRVLEDAPKVYRRGLERAYQGKAKSAAIRAFCLRCVGYVRKDVTGCTSCGCPLWPYRPYRKGDR